MQLIRIGVPIVVLVGLLTVWELASASAWQPDYILPAPSDIVRVLGEDREIYWDNSLVTLTEVVIGLSAGVALGLVVGGVIGLSPMMRRALYPLVVASQSLPFLALAPLLVLWFGFGLLPKIILVVQVTFFPVAVATISGFASVSAEALVFGRSLGASSVRLLTKVRIPASLPHVFSGLKISASYAAVAAVIAEFTGSIEGLGALMLRANEQLETAAVFAALFLITVIGVGAFALVTLLERLVVPWHERFRGGGY